MTLQEIDDQLELLRLKELAMSDIEVRSKMVILISDRRKENPPYHSFCEYTHCTERIARMFGAMPFGAAIMTPREIAKERKLLLALKEQLKKNSETMIHYDIPALQLIESEIRSTYNTDADYPQSEFLLDIRRRLLNNQALMRKNQEKLMPHIIAFNEALRDALKHMYDRAHGLYHQMSAIQPDIELIAKCYLANNYPLLHPYQEEDRQDLWDALCDSGWNQLYDDGVSFPLVLPRDIKQSFDALIGMDCPPPNWNEGLDRELTKDCHLIQQFHHLFEHTKFAITDFIFCRDFVFEYSIITEEKTTNKEQ